MRGLNFISLAMFLVLTTLQEVWSHGDQPLSKIAIHKATIDLNHDAYVKASPTVLGLKEQTTEWVTLEYSSPKPSADDWIGVFSPANFNSSTCPQEKPTVHPPQLCSAPIKYQFANYSSPKYKDTGKGYLKLQLINQRSDFSFALFSSGLSNPKLVAVSNQVAFANPNAPVYPRLAQGKQWNEMTVTWTSGYGINEAGAFVEWGPKGGDQVRSPAGTLTFNRNSMCGAPARTVGWRGPVFIHTSFLNELWLNAVMKLMWDQFTAQVEPIASTVPNMIASGNHERDWPGTRSFNGNMDFGGECGVLAETMFYVPAENRAKFRYSTDYGMFCCCIANTEHDKPSNTSSLSIAWNQLTDEGSFEEPMGTESLQKLWQKYKVDITMYGHVHNYERTCPIYQNICTNEEKHYYKGPLNGTIHVVAGESPGIIGTSWLALWIVAQGEADSSFEFEDFQPASLNTTKQLIEDLNDIDIVFHIGDIVYAMGYIAQWDQFIAQIEPIASTKPYMIGSGNHECVWPGTGSFYQNMDSGGECGVLAEKKFYVPAENRANFWYSTDYVMFQFCLAHTELYWRGRSEQYKFIENCLASVDRQRQPWLIFLAQRSFEEPMGREDLKNLWQKNKVDIALYGHVHKYERSCPVYENICTSQEKHNYIGPLKGTIHVIAGGGGASLHEFAPINTTLSIYKDYDNVFVKLTAFDHSYLLFEYKKCRDGKVYDSFTISRAQPARALASKLSGEVPDCLFDDGASTLGAFAASVGL
nr:putative inactive purple acid phosphatase 1 [Quercus suber]